MKCEYEHWNISIIGNAHLNAGKSKQDYSDSYEDNSNIIITVSDGHGANEHFRSARGAELAVKSAETAFSTFLCQKIDFEDACKRTESIKKLINNTVDLWNNLVESDFEEYPFTDDELSLISEKHRIDYLDKKHAKVAYGATLISVAVTKEYCIGIQIGDGSCLIIDSQGDIKEPIPVDEKCFLQTTTSLCGTNASNDFRYFFMDFSKEKIPAAAFVATDGVENLYGNGEYRLRLYKAIAAALCTSTVEKCKEELTLLLSNLSPKSDDISISCFFNKKALSEIYNKPENVSETEYDPGNMPTDTVNTGNCNNESEKDVVVLKNKINFKNKIDKVKKKMKKLFRTEEKDDRGRIDKENK